MSETLSNIVRRNDRVSPTASLHVEIIADFACPFSFVGKRRFDKALTAVQGPSDLSWYPYQLNPDIPAAGMGFDEYLIKRFGSRDNVAPVLKYLEQEGLEVGVEFRFDRIKRVPNTLAAHQLMQLAETLGKNQSALAEDLFAAFFEQGKDLGDTEVLVELARPHGMDAGEIAKAIGSDAVRQIVQTREAQVRASGLSGVPGFLLNRRLLVVGAQEADNIVNAFDRAMFGEGTDQLVSPALH